ncbi:pyridoxal phosphate-dependent transferase [Aspergillus floccosus]
MNDKSLEKWKLLHDIQQQRAESGKLVAGVAAVCNTDLFKTTRLNLPKAKRWMAAHLSRESKSRPQCILKQAASYLSKPGIVSLGGGLPSSECFLFCSWTLSVPTPPHFVEKDNSITNPPATQAITIGKHDLNADVSEYDLSIALNYCQATGSPQMMRFITKHTELVFNPPYQDWKMCLTVGSTGALGQAIRMLCDRHRGDTVLTEEFTFATALETLVPQGIKPVAVPMDEEGLIPDALDAILNGWNEKVRGARKPHVLYTIPSQQNPTGATQSLHRRRNIYTVCHRHDVYIIEDDPYYFLQMPPYREAGNDGKFYEDVGSFLARLIPSYVSLDVDGRVLRLDSFSKVLIPGSRLGWITASAQIVERYIRHAEVSNQGPSGGHESYIKWLIKLKAEYTRRRNMLLAACERSLPRSVVSWSPPATGMFLWLKLDHHKHPQYPSQPADMIEGEVFDRAIRKGVLCARGSWFRAEPDTPTSGMFFRMTFASAGEETISVAIERLGEALRESFRLE